MPFSPEFDSGENVTESVRSKGCSDYRGSNVVVLQKLLTVFVSLAMLVASLLAIFCPSKVHGKQTTVNLKFKLAKLEGTP